MRVSYAMIMVLVGSSTWGQSRPAVYVMSYGSPSDRVPVVKEAPYSAVETLTMKMPSESARVRSVNLFRDSAGRTRKERHYPGQTSGVRVIEIEDPVAGFRYVLDQQRLIAHRSVLPARGVTTVPGISSVINDGPLGTPTFSEIAGESSTPGASGIMHSNAEQLASNAAGPGTLNSTELLGTRMIEGVFAAGTRKITTFPAGKMGNPTPYKSTRESWYSLDLKVQVLLTISDERGLSHVEQLTEIRRDEPDKALFQLPENYKIVDERGAFTFDLIH